MDEVQWLVMLVRKLCVYIYACGNEMKRERKREEVRKKKKKERKKLWIFIVVFFFGIAWITIHNFIWSCQGIVKTNENNWSWIFFFFTENKQPFSSSRTLRILLPFWKRHMPSVWCFTTFLFIFMNIHFFFFFSTFFFIRCFCCCCCSLTLCLVVFLAPFSMCLIDDLFFGAISFLNSFGRLLF